ncbi:MAG: flagellar biosynthesis protein FlhB [Candidatus Sericytochromatia bacterium]|nr:flagellar biosynthesis protein FlhB [Candidatus Sericytochromatia bacterium]
MSEDKDSKTEDATPKRRQEARQKGQILKSKEVNTAALILMAAYALNWSGPHIYKTIYKYILSTYYEMPWFAQNFKLSDLYGYGVHSTKVLLFMLAPIFLIVFFTALIVELVQVGILISGKPLKPQLERIHPVKGFKRVFSLKSLVELVKSAVKTIIIGLVVYTTIKAHLPMIIYSIKNPVANALVLAGVLLVTIAKKAAAAMVAVAFIDYFYQRWEFEKSLRMSKQEVKDEYKQTEGDPLIKGKQKQKMRQMSMGQVRQAVPDASAVVSNPTHYAVGIRYDEGMDAPKIVAKGRDELAIYIKEVAKEHDIPIFEDPPLARGLYNSCELGEFIHPDFYMAIAKIIAHLMKQKGAKPPPGEQDSGQRQRSRQGKGMNEEDRRDLSPDGAASA